jgi:RNA polymerase sigma-70 factor, ECF subfamily
MIITLEPRVQERLLAAIPQLHAFAISLCRNSEEAGDLVQTTLLRACANIGQFKSGSNMEAWLFTILRNHFYSEYRRRRNSSRLIGEIVETRATNPQQIASIECHELRAALAKLVPEQREALMLVGACGFSYDQAAGICGCSVGTIKSRVSRGRKQLALLLSIDDAEFEPDAIFSAVTAGGGRPAADVIRNGH